MERIALTPSDVRNFDGLLIFVYLFEGYLSLLNIKIHLANTVQIDLEGPIVNLCAVVSRFMD